MNDLWKNRVPRFFSAFLLLVGCASEREVRPQEPVLIPGVTIGMSRAQLERIRPAVTDDSGYLSERIAPGEQVIYWFGRDFHASSIPSNRLAIVVRTVRPEGAERDSLMDAVRDVEQQWNAQLGTPDTIQVRELVRNRGARTQFHARIWSIRGQYVILTFERPANPRKASEAAAYSLIIQDWRLAPEVSLPNS